MHELSLIREIIDAATAAAAREGATRIHAVTLSVGDLAGVDPDALAFAFGVAAAGTAAEGGTLHIDPVPVRCHCETCLVDFAPLGRVYRCPACASVRTVRVTQGTELELTAVEVS